MKKSPAHRDLGKCKLCIWVSQTCMADKHPSEFLQLLHQHLKNGKGCHQGWGWIEGRILSHHQTVQGIASNYTARVTENSKVETFTFEMSLPSSLSYACWRLMPYSLRHQFYFAVSHYGSFAFILSLFWQIQLHLDVTMVLLCFLDSLDWMESQIPPTLSDILSLCDIPKTLPCDFGLIGNWKGTLGYFSLFKHC